jgi:hypothetical protein
LVALDNEPAVEFWEAQGLELDRRDGRWMIVL